MFIIQSYHYKSIFGKYIIKINFLDMYLHFRAGLINVLDRTFQQLYERWEGIYMLISGLFSEKLHG